MKVATFRNIYVQLDNTGSNKCGTVITACALLVKLGICRKVKINFLEVGHTHEDIDALIGSVVVKLRKEDHPTFVSRMKAICTALTEADAQIKAVEEVIGITDYAAVLDYISPPLTGLFQVQFICFISGYTLFLCTPV